MVRFSAPGYAGGVKQRTIAWPVGATGLGAMPMSLQGRPDRPRAIATIHAALDAGITLIDTADAYCTSRVDTGHNERLVAEALRSRGAHHDEVLVATKGGHRHRVSLQQVAQAWSLPQGEVVIPIPGASRPSTITDSARAAELSLDQDELSLLGMVA